MLKSLTLALYLLASSAIASEKLTLELSNTVLLRGEVTQESVTKVQLEISELNKKRLLAITSPIYLVLDSPGGDIQAGEALNSYLKTVDNLRTVTIFAASMASAIVEAVPGKRYITEDGTLMFHRARVGISGQVETGEVESRLAWIKSIILRMENRNASRMRMTLVDYKARVKDEMWFDAQQSLANHAADVVVDIVCDKSLIEASENVSIETMFGSIPVTYSKCPLFRYPIAAKSAE